MDKLAALEKMAIEGIPGGGIAVQSPVNRPAAPSKPAAQKMTREEWLRMGQENGWGGASTNAPAKPAVSGHLGDDKWSRFPGLSRRPRSGGDGYPSRDRFPELGWKDGDPVPPGYQVVELPTYPPKIYIVKKPRAL